MLRKDAMMRTQKPRLEVGDGAMSVRQHFRRLFGALHEADAMLVARLLQPFVTAPSVRVDRTAGLDGPLDKRDEALCGDVVERAQSDPSTRSAADFDCQRDGRLRLHLAANHVLLLAADICVVDLDFAAKLLPIRVDRRPAQLMEHRPRGLVTRKAKLALELKRRYPRRQRRHEVRRAEPLHQRRTSRVHDRASGDGDLIPAWFALIQATPGQCEGLLPPATRADESVGPAALHQIGRTGLLGGEQRLKLCQRSREARTGHTRILHMVAFGVKWISIMNY